MEGIFDKNRTWMKAVAIVLTFLLSFSMWSIPAYAAEGSGGYASAQIGFFGGSDSNTSSHDADAFAAANDNGIVPFAVTYADADYEVRIGGNPVTITGGEGLWSSHEWSVSSDGGEATIESNDRTATVTGTKPGLVTVTHKYTLLLGLGSKTETFTVRVLPAYVSAMFNLNGGTGTTPNAIENQEPDTTIALPTAQGITRDGYTFVGWSANQDADPADPESGTIVAAGGSCVLNDNVTFYAIWSKNMVETTYTVQHVLAGGKVVKTETRKSEAWVNDDPKMIAITPGDLDSIDASSSDIEGYEFSSMTIDKGAITTGTTEVQSGSTITLTYAPRTDLSYTVNYLEQGTDKELAKSVTVEGQTFGSTIVVDPIAITGYVAPAAQSITIGVKDNEVNFYYAPRTDLSYTVNYMFKGEDDTTRSIAEPKIAINQTFGTTITEQAIKVPGYVASEPTEQSITIGVEGNVVTFYYTTNTNVAYTVRAIDEAGNVISEELVESNMLVGQRVTVNAPAIPGYALIGDASQLLELTDNNDVVEFRYAARGDLTYQVQFWDAETDFPIQDLDPIEGSGMAVGQKVDVSGMIPSVPGYQEAVSFTLNGEPYELEDGKYLVISGDENILIVRYAKRTDLSYTVNYIDQDTGKVLDSKTEDGQTFKATVVEEAIDIEGYNKVEPIAANFEVGANSDQNVISFYYTKRTDLSYTVNYLEQGTDKVLHEPLTRNNQAFDAEITESAIDIEGYNALAPESITFNIKVDADANEYTFYYTPRTDLSYTVNFLELGTSSELAEAETVENQTFGAVIEPEQAAQDIRGYRLSESSQGITIGATNNVLNLYYEKRTDLEYTVKCLLVKDDQEFIINEGAEPITGQTYGDTVSVNAPVLAGYTLLADQPQSKDITIDVEGNVVEFRYALRADLEYTVLYVDQRTGSELLPSKTVTGQEYGSKVTETAPTIEGYELDNPDDATITIEIAEMGNLIQFIYVKVATLSYTVNYLEKGTDEVVADQKVVENQTFGDEVTAQEEVIDIPGYAYDSADKASITIGTDSNENVINLYYAKRADLAYTVNYLDSETNEPIKDALTVTDQVFQSQVDVADVAAAPESVIDGYNYLRSNVVGSLTISAEENAINLYYAKRADLSYTVNHLDADGNSIEVPTVVENVIFGTEVASEDAAVEIVGYAYDADRASTLTVGTDADQNVLNVYYTKRTDLTYVVNYLELGASDDAEPLAMQKVVENQEFGATIDAADEVIDIDGYNYDSLSADQLVLTSTDEPAALNIYYTKRTDLSYTVKYLQEGTETEVRASETFEDQVFGTVITAIAPTDITGYTNVDPTEASITLGTGENVIVFYYAPIEGLSYTVNYVDRVTGEPLVAAKTVEGQVFGTEVSEEPIPVKGYYPASEEAVTFTIGLENNVVTINYDVRTDLSYTVNYLEQGTDKELAELETVGNQTYLEEVSAQAIDIDGYNAADPVSGTLVIGAREDVENNAFTFYYTPRTDLSYTVNYLTRDADGTERVLETAKVVNGTDEEPVTFGATVTEEPIEIPGYVTPDAPESIVIALEGNDVNFYYTPRTDLSYTVNYLEQDTNNVLHEAKVVENQTFGDTIMLADEAIDIEGYSVVEPSGALTIGVEGNVIDIFYQKIDNLSYTVRYVDAAGTELLPSETVTGYAYGAQISVAAESIDGYVPDAESKDLTIGLGENAVTFTYAPRTDLSYTVNYVEVDTNILVADALVVADQTFGVEIAAEDVARTFDGFTYVRADRESFEIGTNEADNTITLYYVRNTNLSYTVRYVDADGESVIDDKVVGPEGADGVTEVGEVAFGETVSETAPDIKGYNLTSNRMATHVIDVSDNVITFTYEKRADLSYTVNYLEQGTDDVAVAEAKTVENVAFGDEVRETAPEIAGYTLVGADAATITIGERDDITDNVINFYYEPITNLTYTVNYLEEDTNKPLRDPKTEAGQRMGATISTSGEAGFVIEGYQFVSVDPEELVIGADSAANVINVYYAPIVDLSYTVNFLDAENPSISLAESVTVNDVAYGTTVAVSDAAKAIDGFVLDAENADFTVGLGDNQFNIYYQRRADMPYTINYLERDTDAVLAEPTQASDGVFEEMIYANDEGIAKAIDGYVFDDQSEYITIGADASQNVLNVYYVKRSDLSYTVNYLEADTFEQAQPSKIINDATFEDVVQAAEEAVEIAGYTFDSADKGSLAVGTDASQNVLNLYYSKRTDLSYTLNFEGTDFFGNVAEVHDSVVESATFKDVIDLADYQIVGGYRLDSYTYNGVPVDPEITTITVGAYDNVLTLTYVPRTDLTYIVRHVVRNADGSETELDRDVLENMTFGQMVGADARDFIGYQRPEESSIFTTIGATEDENTHTFYYTLSSDVVCTVNHIDESTDEVIRTTSVEGLALGDEVTAASQVLSIPGYEFARAGAESLTVSSDEDANVINLYYSPLSTLSYTVRYLEQGTDAVLANPKVVGDCTLNEEVVETAETIEGYELVGDAEVTFTIEADENDITFYYTPRTDLSYTVNYLEWGTDAVLATASTVGNQTFGDTVDAADEIVQIDGYRFDSADVDSIQIGVQSNMINLYYAKRTDLSYTVRYLEQGTDAVLATTKTVRDQTYQAEVAEEAIEVEGYVLRSPEAINFVIDTGENEITFYYAKRTDLTYTVSYLEQDTDEVLAETKVVNGQTFQADVVETAASINGYNVVGSGEAIITIGVQGNDITFYYTPRTDLSYTVNYRVQGTDELLDSKVVRDQTFGTTLTEQPIAIEGYNAVDASAAEITVGTGTNVHSFYYVPRADLSYTVRYLEQGTDASVADDKVVGNQTYRTQVTEQAAAVAGYRVVGDATKDITIGLQNEPVVFYYEVELVTPPSNEDDYPVVPAPPVDYDVPNITDTTDGGGAAGVPGTPTVPTAGDDTLAPGAGDAADAGAGANAGDAADADAAGATIEDDANPLAGPNESTINDDATPMGAFDSPTCWAHNLMILGILLTLIYGIGVIARRLGYAKRINSFGILK